MRVIGPLLRLLAFSVLAAPLAHSSTIGLSINAIFDNTIMNDPNAAAIEGAIGTAIQTFETLYSNPISVSIYFQEGGGLGESNFEIFTADYTDFYEGLIANDANPDAIAALNANGGDALTNGGRNPVGNSTTIQMTAPNGRALGLDFQPSCFVTATGKGTANGNVPNQCSDPGPGTAVDGIISLNTSITDPPNNSPSSNFDLVAATEHEIGEILGLGSSLRNCDEKNPSGVCQTNATLTVFNDTLIRAGTPEDLFRWSEPTGGVRTLSTNCANPTSAYFAYGPNTGELAQFNNSCNNGDFADFQSTPLPSGTAADIQDAFLSPGAGPAYSQLNIDTMTAIGYTTFVPEPSSWLMALPAAALLVLRRRRA
jgi:MYXO-CTERM domain-containing protein